jgi:F-type H+-transporting ATPase subunit b
LLFTILVGAALAFAQPAAQPPHSSGETHAEAAAAHGEGHETQAMPNEIWWKWANFAILATVLGWLISKNAGPFFRSRTEAIQSAIAESAAAKEEAEARAAAIESRVANLSLEVEQLRRQSKDEIAREGERVRAETTEQIRKVQAQAESEIASAAKHASHELKAYSAELAIELAERQIREQLTPQAQDGLANTFVDELKNKAVMN